MQKLDGKLLLDEAEYNKLMDVAQNMAKDSKPKGLCTSKKILIVCWTVAIILTVLTVWAFFFTDKDVSPLITLAGVAVGAAGADTAMYSWKAKAENKIKLTQIMIKELSQEVGIEHTIALAQLVLAD